MTVTPYTPLPDAFLRREWMRFFQRYRQPGPVLDELLRAYRSSGRYYHTIEHGLEVARTARTLAANLPRAERDDLYLAAWTHDAHYQPEAVDNEERSADLAQRLATQLGMGDVRAKRVAALVIVSSHTVRPATELEAMMCDADLAVLAKPWSGYLADVHNIRAELGITDDATWRTTRLSMLRFFDTKDPIYYGEAAAASWEQPSSANRQRERQLLG